MIELKEWHEREEGQAHIQAQKAERGKKNKGNKDKRKQGGCGCGNDKNLTSSKKQRRLIKQREKEIIAAVTQAKKNATANKTDETDIRSMVSST